ncbi:solute carrier family 2, facilitated glucose transporter member 9-like isoform X4 [Petromyzon marinus]|uniref:solute carrier family 2, facilitated glucose transporter member 9-like isoform X4 n=1 Tax=Petromyzon marinus TaxID=7757 RepID=UPI003F6FDE82
MVMMMVMMVMVMMMVSITPDYPALRWLRAADDDSGGSVEREMEQMEEERSVQARSVLDLLRDPRLRRQIVIIVALNVMQQFSGINAAGISDEEAPFVTLGTGIAEAVTTLVFGLTVDLLGRRPLLICGFGLTSICSVLITVSMLLQVTITWLSYVSVAMLFAFIICFALGPAGIIGILPAELFMQSERPGAFVIAGTVNWGSFIIISVVFPFLMESLGPFCFLLFSADCLLAAVLVHRWLPETKNRSLLDIARHFEAVGRGHAGGGLAGTGAGGGLAGDAAKAAADDATAINNATAAINNAAAAAATNDDGDEDDEDEEDEEDGPPPTTHRGVTALLTKLPPPAGQGRC